MKRRAVVLSLALLAAACAPPTPPAPPAPLAGAKREALVDFLRQSRTTGFIVIQHGRVLIEEHLPPPADDASFRYFVHGTNGDGEVLEDVASLQKSVVGVLVAIAIYRGLVDPDASVGHYLGNGWSKASPRQEAAIRVIDLLTMSSGLDERFQYSAPPGQRFFYNTPVYAVTKEILAKASGQSLDAISRAWLTGPLGMADTAWRKRPAAFADVGNATALVTTSRDLARLGTMVLHRGTAPDGARIVSERELNRLFEPSPANPAYGRLWWRNGGTFAIGATGDRREGPLTKGGPSDLVAGLGFLDRRLYVVPSLDLVAVRTGAASKMPGFDEALWRLLQPMVKDR